MSGFNLPPGCSVSDIPGNRPEDLAEEAFWEALADKADGLDLPDGWYRSAEHPVAKLIEIVREIVYRRGFSDGYMEALIDQSIER